MRRGADELGASSRRRGRRADRAARGRRRAVGAQHPRARRARRRRRRTDHRSSTSRTRRASGRSSTTRPRDAHYDFTSAFIKSMRGSDPDAARLLPRRDARRRRGRALHRAAHDRARLRGHRQRRPARAARRRRGGAGGRARRPARGAAQSRAGGDLPRAGAEVERELRARSTAATRDVRERGNVQPPKALRDGSLLRPPARPRRGLRLSARRPARLRGRLPAGRARRARTYYEPSGNGEESE